MPRTLTPQEQVTRKIYAIGEYLKYAHADLEASVDLNRPAEILADLHLVEWKTRETIALVVELARYQGVTWQEIADSLGVSKQAAQQRYGDQ